MCEETKRPLWMDDESVKNIPQRKLDFLGKMFADSQGKSQKELIRMMMPMMQKAKQENLIFTPQEMNAAIAAIRKYSSKEELEQIDHILKKVK